MLEGFDVFERIDDYFVDGVIHGLYLDVDEGLFWLLVLLHYLYCNQS